MIVTARINSFGFHVRCPFCGNIVETSLVSTIVITEGKMKYADGYCNNCGKHFQYSWKEEIDILKNVLKGEESDEHE